MGFLFQLVDPKTGDETPITVSVDDGIRASTTLATLGKLKPVFKKDGTTTAGTFPQNESHCREKSFFLITLLNPLLRLLLSQTGNSSQVSDGAGAVLLMRRSVATQKGLPVLGVFR